jgi:hypothetical protein
LDETSAVHKWQKSNELEVVSWGIALDESVTSLRKIKRTAKSRVEDKICLREDIKA